ncbi:hypothetical protein G5B38_09460 [Pseudohalocynthiibacter aestuariivivens]|uniref:DUF6173 family protein n=1 Tax=Roseovarius pelagicus TaxID=2980108 RepID=A0ABY6D893_9RHOB|nr:MULTISPECIES: DUF6173 family protein [Rhodobacterales]QIE45730.1 hypothetical protein G5B38_09460 [Pseudohalocynthiibacter aestuariivivens]UXX82342.1 DUF6173 family protein [Roseovarius pelagicus]
MDNQIMTSAEVEEAAALPRCHEVHTDPDTPNAAAGAPATLGKKPVEQKSPAQWAYERLILYIQNFEKTLDSEHEVAMGFTGGDAGILRIEGMGYFDPDIVTFYGSDPAGGKTQLVQHVGQLSVLLRAVPKPEPAAEATRIGFRLAADLDKA